jgi:hypothetical protein
MSVKTVVAEMNTPIWDAFVNNDVFANGLTVDHDSINEPVCDAKGDAMRWTEEFSETPLTREHGRGRQEHGSNTEKQAAWRVESVNHSNLVLANISAQPDYRSIQIRW